MIQFEPLHQSGLPAAAVCVGTVDINDPAEIIIILRRSPDAIPAEPHRLANIRARPTEEEFEIWHGAHPDEITAVSSFLTKHGLTIVKVHRGAKQITATGTIGSLNSAFQIKTALYSHKGNTFRHHADPVSVPSSVRPFITYVLGLNTKPIEVKSNAVRAIPEGFTSDAEKSLTVQQVCQLYNFPTNTAAGQNIAIFEIPDLSTHVLSDIQLYFTNKGKPLPTIVNVSPPPTFTPTTGDGLEANLDISVAGDAAPGATICMYYSVVSAQLTDIAMNTILTRIIFPPAGDPVCQVLSASWGLGDGDDPNGVGPFIDTTFQDAAAQGVTVIFSSGDQGSDLSNASPPFAGLQAPLGSYWVLGAGGTTIANLSPRTEYLWNDGSGAGGGGVSQIYPVAPFQSANNVIPPVNVTTSFAGRGVPDFSGNASPNSGYLIYINGVAEQVGGTSATAPLFAAMMAVINARLQITSGYILPTVYANPSIFLDITPALGGPANNNFNGVSGYPVTVGWDACTGLGVPNATSLMNAISIAGPVITITGITLSTTTFLASAPVGTVVGVISVQSVPGPFKGTLSLSNSTGALFKIVGNNLVTAGVMGVGTYNTSIIATQNVPGFAPGQFGSPTQILFTITAAPTPQITGITLSNSTFPSGSPSGTVVGNVGVTAINGTFAGSIALTGTNAASFQLIGTSNPAQATLATNGSLGGGAYSISIVATQTGPILFQGSPFTQAETITGVVTTTITGITLSNATLVANSPSGTVVGAVTVQITGTTFVGSLSLSGPNASSFAISGSNLVSSGVVTQGSYSIDIVATQSGVTGSPFSTQETITVAAAPAAITGIALSSSTISTTASTGSVVGAITVQTTGGAFSGTLTVSGTNASTFAISGANLVTAGTVIVGSYSINIVATQSGATGSPFTQAETITGVAASGVTITGITLSSSSFPANSPAGTVVGLITVATTTSSTTPVNGIYVLSGVVASAIAAAPVHTKVVEATSDGAGTFLPASTVTTMKAPGTIVLGYFDCGFCESFRPYYTTAKNAGIIVNPTKPVFGSGNSAEYSVEFWTPTWLTISQNWITSIINAGYDGVYLDVIDGWNYSGSNGTDPVVVAAGGLSQSANFMTTYIQNLRTFAQGVKPGFLIWVNGAEELFNPSLAGYNFTVATPYASVIDGMLKEQVLYPNSTTPSNAANRTLEQQMLSNCTKAGKPVVLVEYITGAAKIADVKTTTAGWGFGYYVANPNQNLSGVDTEGWTGVPG